MGDVFKDIKEAKMQRGIDVRINGKGKIGIPNEPKLPLLKDPKLPKF